MVIEARDVSGHSILLGLSLAHRRSAILHRRTWLGDSEALEHFVEQSIYLAMQFQHGLLHLGALAAERSRSPHDQETQLRAFMVITSSISS